MSGQTAKSRRPSKVKVMMITYVIRWLNEDEWFTERYDNEEVGRTERSRGVISIRIDSQSNEDSLKEVLVHELLHCCTEMSSTAKFLKEVGDPEEFWVAQVSPVLTTVLKENPALVAYLTS